MQKPLHFSKKCGMIDKHEKIRLSVPEVTGEVNAKKRHSIGQSADGNGFRTLFYFLPVQSAAIPTGTVMNV